MLTVSAEFTAFELPPSGPHAARCCAVIDLGSQESSFDGKPRLQRKVLLTWELAEQRADGMPFKVSRRFGLSLHENSALRGFIESWRGRPFTPDELKGFDLRRLLGQPCLLNLAHVERAGRQYANILSISPLPRGMSAPELSGPATLFDLDAPDAEAVLETLSESLQAVITASPEWRARLARERDRMPGEDGVLPDDDIPF